MFFFFVGGLEQQAGRVIKEAAGRCIRCGSTADLVEYEKVLKLFFIPVWRWPGKSPALYCGNCSLISPHSLPINGEPTGGSGRLIGGVPRCHSCARPIDGEFRFCPYCGSSL